MTEEYVGKMAPLKLLFKRKLYACGTAQLG
jgi:hypothetical protein